MEGAFSVKSKKKFVTFFMLSFGEIYLKKKN